MSVIPTSEGWNEQGWNYSNFGSYGGGQFVPVYSAHGAYVIAGTGGHAHPDNHGALVFDFTTGLWSRLDNANGVARRSSSPWAYPLSASNGGPYYEVSGSEVPLPPHLYGNLVYLPYGGKGSVAIVTRAGIGVESTNSNASHIFDLQTQLWRRLTTSLSRRVSVEGDSVYDASRNRVWLPTINPQSYSDIEYLDLADLTIKTTARMTSGISSLLGGYKRCWMHGSLLLRNCGTDGLWLYDPDVPASGWVRANVSGSLPASNHRWARYSNGNYYAFAGNAASNTVQRVVPPANPKTGTWVADTITLGGATLPRRAFYDTVSHYSRLCYVPAIDCIAWIPGGRDSVVIFRPGS